MHPAFSVIFFTVASGTGYGLLFLFAVLGGIGLLPVEKFFGLFGIGTGLALVTFGLLSSTYHLGHRERALGAFSQWRTSWLSREGVVAAGSYIPALLYLYVWVYRGGNAATFEIWAAILGVLAVITVYCTAMIYRSLATIHQWHNQWTAPVYLSMALAGGAVILIALMGVFGIEDTTASYCAVGTLAFAWILKNRYWKFIDTTAHPSTPESATGLGHIGKVRMLDGPHTEDSYLLTEMGFRVARKHTSKLRRHAQVLGFAFPIALISAASLQSGTLANAVTVAAAVSFLLGAVIERWLFFAEAKHTVTLYYGAESA